MKTASCVIDKDYIISEVPDNIFGSFIEHLGRAVYTGIYEPDHPEADENGFRKDVLELVRNLKISLTRYPGGNFVSGYRWTDGIGPRENRPRRLDYAWRSIETNQFGLDDFVRWSKKADTEIMAAVNLGTGTPQDAGDMIEYCNFPEGTYFSDLRIKNGNKEPHNIKYWCLGNEMDGPWQTGHLSAEDYSKKAKEAAKILKWVDPDIKLIACGSSTTTMPTYPEWDRVVLEYLYENVDYISLHRYYENEGDISSFLASFIDMNDFINTIVSIADYVKAKNRSKKRLMLSFDEWNVWYQKKLIMPDWETAPPLLEDNYSMLDALVFSGLICTLLNNSDRVKIACLAQLVNVIAPIFTEKGGRAIKQTIYYPFQHVSHYGRGNVLKTLIKCESVDTEKYGPAPVLQASATNNTETGEITVFILNCSQSDPVKLELDMRSFGTIKPVEHIILNEDDYNLKNTFNNPDAVIPRSQEIMPSEKSKAEIELKPLSWNVIRFREKV
jgi:alpha-L-arabinofuranosidase